jgi:hypothetical protein
LRICLAWVSLSACFRMPFQSEIGDFLFFEN